MTGHFDGYVEVHSKDEVAVMEALMKHGPLAVGVDASFDEFLFYSYAPPAAAAAVAVCAWLRGCLCVRHRMLQGHLSSHHLRQ